jgi:ABC transporter substrate binding protein
MFRTQFVTIRQPVSIMLAELGVNRLQLLKEAIPSLTRVVALWNPPTPYHAKAVENLKAVAPSLAIELSFVSVRTPEELGPAFEAVDRAHAQALYVIDAPPSFTHRATLLNLAAKARLAVVSGERPYVEDGGLMSYGPSYEDEALGGVRRQDPQRGQARRTAHRPADQVHAHRQSQDRAGARHHHLQIDPAAQRRSHPVTGGALPTRLRYHRDRAMGERSPVGSAARWC